MGLSVLDAFAAEVGPVSAGPVVASGGRTQWGIGGAPLPGTREVVAPGGVVAHEPAEMTVRVRAGTRLEDLRAELGRARQRVVLDGAAGATVGGVLAVGRSGIARLGRGPVRDAVLEVRYVSAEGAVVTGGGPTVKNVSGYDLPRLLVGSLGTLGLLAEVVLRTQPLPADARWYAVDERDPFALQRALHHPASVLWDGTTTWIHLEGHPADLDDQARAQGLGAPAAGPPPLPPCRWSLAPGALATLPGDGLGAFLAEVGVGTVHRHLEQPARPLAPPVRSLNEAVKRAFDPTGRLAPGRCAW